ncbi:MAG: hypothetical protein IT305_27665 [Chloroflexi bacterium]|nr:hypothetical protein [Chloroflexota bacterium]
MDGTNAGWPRGLPPGRAGQCTPAAPRALLTAQDMRRLTLFKWRYSLESAGFSPRQAERLLFLKWLHTHRGRRG